MGAARRAEAMVRSQGSLHGDRRARRNRSEPEAFARPEGVANGGEEGGAVSGTTVVLLAILAAAVALVVLNRLEFLSEFPRRRRRPRPGGDGPEGGPPAA